MADPIKVVENKEKIDELVSGNPGKLVIVQFYATWCGPCRLVEPKLKKMAGELANEAVFAKIDVEGEGCEPLLDLYQIKVTPTFLVLKKGAKVALMHGNVMNELRESIKKNK